MHDIISTLTNLATSSTNQFLSGGLVLLVVGSIGATLRKWPSQLWQQFLRMFTVVVEVTDSEYTYAWFLLWLQEQALTKHTRRLRSKSLNGANLLLPAEGTHFFLCGWRPMWFTWKTEAEGKEGMYPKKLLIFRWVGRTRGPVYAMLKEGRAIARKERVGKLAVWLRRDGKEGWTQELRHKRPLASVMLPTDGLTVLADMRRFLTNAAWYASHGVPYRRGYLFHGPPGSGKSSAAVSFAGELDIPLYVLNLGSIVTDTQLESAIYTIDTSAPVMLLIEDIDTAMPQRDKDRTAHSFSLGTLLNVLDGVLARENLILVATTNRKSVLDPALIRPGRIDRTVLFTDATQEQINAAIMSYFPEGQRAALEALIDRPEPISMAMVQETLLALYDEQAKAA